MNTLTMTRTEQVKVEILSDIAKNTSVNEQKWVSFSKNGLNIYVFEKRLGVFDEQGLQEIYTVEKDEIHFLGYLVHQDWVQGKLDNSPIDIAKMANRNIWSEVQ